MRSHQPFAKIATAAALCTTLGVVLAETDAQAADRKVLAESFTSIYCVYCPYVGRALNQLKDDQANLLAFQVHTTFGGDPYATPWGNARDSFYGVGGIPHVQIDGMIESVGSWQDDTQDYNALLGHFNTRQAVPTDVTIQFGAQQISGPDFLVGARVTVEPGGVEKTMRVYMAQTLADYPTESTDGRYFDCVMYGATMASTVTVGPGEYVDVNHQFTIDATSWADPTALKIFVWVQETNASGPAEIHQAEMVTWPFPGLPDADCNDNGIMDLDDLNDCDGSSWCSDCNGNAIIDVCDIAGAFSDDCDGNGIPDSCDMTDCDGSTWCSDCNDNGIPDGCDISTASSDDCNTNGTPDECEVTIPLTASSGMVGPFGYTRNKAVAAPDPDDQVHDVTIELLTSADIANVDEYVTVDINGTVVGTLYDDGLYTACHPAGEQGTIVVPAATFNAAMVGFTDCIVTAAPSSTVHPSLCGGNSWVIIDLTYEQVGSNDANNNGIPDDCEGPACPEDLADPVGVEQQDLNAVLNRWGDPQCDPGGIAYPCPEDLATPDGVEQQDLNAVLNRWGDPTCEPLGLRERGAPRSLRSGSGSLSR